MDTWETGNRIYGKWNDSQTRPRQAFALVLGNLQYLQVG